MAILLLVIGAVVIGVIAFQLGQQQSSVAAQMTPTPTPPASRTAAPLPVIVTNTPTPPATPTPTGTATPTLSPTPTSTPTATPTPTPTPVVVINHINSLGRLETTEFAMRTVIDLENPPSNLWEKIVGADKLMLVAEGEVVAGFDLAVVTESNIKVEGSRVEVTLPAPEILYSRIDNDRTHVYKRETGLLVEPDKTLEGRARLLAEQALIDWALERDILDKAERDGLVQIENLLRSLGFTEVIIKIEKGGL